MRRSDDGFTLIEVLIAMVLLVIAVAMLGSGLMDALRSSSGARAGGVSDAAIARAAALLDRDVASAETADRALGLVRDPYDLAAAVRSGDPMENSDPSTAQERPNLDIDDISEATSDSFTVQADVVRDQDHRVECVRWRASPAQDQSFTIERIVKSACGTDGTLIQRETVLSVPAGSTVVDRHPFTYVLQCAPDACPNTQTPHPHNRPCDTWQDANPDADHQLRWIVGVRARFIAVAQQAQSAASTTGTVSMSLRSRDTIEYKAALGC